MSLKLKDIAARRAALGLQIIAGALGAVPVVANRYWDDLTIKARVGVPADSDYPRSSSSQPVLVVSDSPAFFLSRQAKEFADWLKAQYQAKVEPFGFVADIPLDGESLPSDRAVSRAARLLRKSGWQVSITTSRTGSQSRTYATLMHPDAIGF